MNADSTIALRTGAQMPVLGLGTWELTHHTAQTVSHAIGLGYRMIDTACDYGSQAGIGEALRQTGKRDAIYLAAKVEETDDAYAATRKYLGEIGVQHADLMLIHRPPADGVGRELWEGLVRARREGFTRDIGVSNYRVEQMRELAEATGEAPVVNQIEWSPFGHARAMRDFCRENQIVIQAYCPLTRAQRLHDAMLEGIASRNARTPAQVLLRWALQSGVVPLPKANRADHLREDIRVFDFELSESDMDVLNGLNEHYSALGSLPYV